MEALRTDDAGRPATAIAWTVPRRPAGAAGADAIHPTDPPGPDASHPAGTPDPGASRPADGPGAATSADGLALTAAQAGMWYAQAVDPDSPALNTADYLEIHGPVRPELFAHTLMRVAQETDALRVRIVDTPDGPRQYPIDLAAPGLGFPLHTADLRTAADPMRAALAWMLADLARPFDLSTGPLFQHALLRVGAQRWLWYQRTHHTVLDGFGYWMLARRTAEVYTALAAGQPPAASTFGRLADLVAEDGAYRSGPQWSDDRAYWTAALADLPDSPALAGRGALPEATFLRRSTEVPDAVSHGLHRTATALRSTWVEMLLAAHAFYLSRATGSATAVLGLPMMGRMGSVALRVPGMVMNVLPLRLSVEPADSLADLIGRVARGVRAARRHQRYRLEDIRRDLGLVAGGRALTGPLVNIMPFHERLTFAGAPASPHNLSTGPVDDITVHLRCHADGTGMQLHHDANPALYREADLAAHQERLVELLTRLSGIDPHTSLSMVDIATAAERRRVLGTFNATRREIPVGTLLEPFEARVRRTPHAPAVIFGGQTVSYAQLDARAGRLARHLAAAGVRPGALAAVALPRSVELIVALVAVLKAGGAYLPLDSGYPAARLADMLEDAAPAAVLTDRAGRAALPATSATVLALDDLDLTGGPGHPAPVALTPQHPAYVIYTSGSTGRPKGVVVSHAAIDNRLRWMQARYVLTAADRVLQKTPAGFDVSVWEFFWPLREGAALVVAEPDGHKDPAYLARTIAGQAVTTCHFVPSMLQVFLAEPLAAGCGALRRVFCSGEALARETAQRFHRVLPAVALHNLYGPTEAAVDVSHHTCVPGATGPVPIGRPVWNTRMYVLDAALQPCPPGITGELYLAGAQLATGYLGRPGLTATRFVADPYGPPGTRMYRTGDLARWSAGGEVEYLGRTDHQVKLRGQRIELGEIESRLAAGPGVRGACVLLREDRPGDQLLVGYVTGAGVDVAALRAGLAEQLPEHMVPTALVALEEFPVGVNGKLDRAALPAPVLEAGAGGGRAPRSHTEELLARLFAEVLGHDRVGVDAAFFDLGGTSLGAARLVARIRAVLGVELPLGALFRAQTPAALADRLAGGDQRDTALQVLLPLRATGRRPPLFVFHPAGGLSWCYSGLLGRLGAEQPVYGLQARGLPRDEPLPRSMDEMAADYAEQLRAVAPHGPYRLLGWSVGGVIAHATAVRLQRAGATVDLLAMMDAYPSDQWRDLAGPTEAQALDALLRMAGYAAGGRLTRDEVLATLRREGSALATLPERVLTAVLGIVMNNARLMREHRHGVYAGDLLFFPATAPRAESWLTPHAWAPYVTGALGLHPLDCLHPQLTQPRQLDAIAQVLRARLDELDRPAGWTRHRPARPAEPATGH